MKKRQIWLISYIISYLLMIVLNYWSATDVGIVADQEQAIIQPAGYAFSIWGLIYVLLFIWIIRLWFIKKKEKTIATVTFWPIVNFLLNGLWIVVFTRQYIGISVLVIFCLTLNVFFIYTKLTRLSTHWYDRFPFSIYFGWVTLAMVVNLFTWFTDMNISQFMNIGEVTWTALVLVLITLLGIAFSFNYQDWVIPLIFVWSYIAILFENQFTYPILALILIVSIACQLLSSIKIIAQVKK